MKKVCVVDTNVVVAGLITGDADSPPVRILDAMLDGDLVYLISPELLDEYASVLRRPRLSRRHRLSDDQIDTLLTELVANAIWREPVVPSNAPDPGDDHLWGLLATYPGAHLVTGDRLLIDHPPGSASVISVRRFVDLFLSPTSG